MPAAEMSFPWGKNSLETSIPRFASNTCDERDIARFAHDTRYE